MDTDQFSRIKLLRVREDLRGRWHAQDGITDEFLGEVATATPEKHFGALVSHYRIRLTDGTELAYDELKIERCHPEARMQG